jgi:hypothetical protein
MSGYKFNIDPKPPKEEKIAEYRNFGHVLHNYQRMTNPLYKTPLYRYRKVFLTLILVLVVAWLITEYGNEEQAHKQQQTVDSTRKADSLSKILQDSSRR